MTNVDLIVERLTQIRQAERKQAFERLTEISNGAAARVGTFVAGDRVFDRVTGQEGEVVGRTAENIVIPVTKR